MNKSTFLYTFVSLAILAMSLNLSAAEISWRKGDGRWHDTGNWIGEALPVAGDSVVFPAGSAYAVEIMRSTRIPATDYLYSVRLAPGSQGDCVTFLDDAKRAIYVAGDGYAFTVGENRKAVFEGSQLYLGSPSVKSYVDVGPNAGLDVDGGRIYIRNGGILVNTNATFTVNDGNVIFNTTAEYLRLAKNATVEFRGGSNIIGRVVNEVSENKGVSVSEFDGEGSKIVFSGGYTSFPNEYALSSFFDASKTELVFAGGILDIYRRIERGFRTLMPPKGGELRNRYAGLALTDEGGSGDVWEFGGTAVFSGDGSYANLGWGMDTVFEGGGRLFVKSVHAGSHESFVDLSDVNVGSDFQSYSHNGALNFIDGITFGAYGDVGVDPQKSARFVPHGCLRFNTADVFDGETLRSFDLHSRFDLSDVTSFEVLGAGSVNVASENPMGYLRRLTVDDGAEVSLTNSNSAIVACGLSLGAGAVLNVGSNSVDVAASVEIGGDAKIQFNFGSLQSGEMYPLWFGPHGTVPPVSKFEFVPALPDGWSVSVSGSTAYLSDGAVKGPDTLESRSYWIGSEGGSWSVSANWTDNPGAVKVPGGNISLASWFSGNRQLAVTNDWSEDFAWMRNLMATESAGPYVLSGKPFAPVYPQNWSDGGASVGNSSRFPFVIESEMLKYHYGDGTERSFFNVLANSDAPIIFAGGGVLTNAVFRFRGDVRIGGDWETLGLYPASGGGRDTRFVLLPGANLLATEQGSNQTVTASYNVSEGASMTLEGDVWRWTTMENTHFVDGVVTSVCPVQATARQTFIGDGSLMLAKVRSDAEGPGELKFMEDVTVRLSAWETARAGADNAMRMTVRDNAVIGAWTDWTYGPQSGFESGTAAADRALTVIGGAKTRVAFDTEGHTITLADPLVVKKWSTVVKQGEGALVLASEENDLADSDFELLGGTLAFDSPQTFGTVKFAGGTITLGGGMYADTYTEMFTAKRIVGEVVASGRCRVKTVPHADGVTVYVRRELGTVVVFR